jgi:hypothetical protein
MTEGFSRPAHSAALVLLVAACAGCASGAGPPGARPALADVPARPIALGAPPALVVDAIVVDRKGAIVDDMRPREFEVVVDGKRRTGIAVARGLRGPGAEAIADLRPAGAGELKPIVEPNRVVVIVIDQASFLPGDEKRARLLAETCVSLFGLSEPVAILPLPVRRGAEGVSFDRAAMRPVLAGLRPLRNTDAAAEPPAAEPDQAPSTADRPPDDRVAPPAGSAKAGAAAAPVIPTLEDMMPTAASGETRSPAAERAHASATLAALTAVFEGLQAVPGAKTVLFLSAGLVAGETRNELDAAAAAAAWAQVRLYALQVPTSASAFAEIGARDLESLAAATGGASVTLTRRPEQALQRLVGELSSSYLLLLAPLQGDLEPVPHALRVASPRGGVTVRAARFVMPGRLTPGQLAPALTPAPAPRPDPADSPPVVPPPAPVGPVAPTKARELALDQALARAAQYVLDFGREMSSVVAEEVYTQEVRGSVPATTTLTGTALDAGRAPQSRRLVSDYLLVKVAGLQGWLPFRDVFEVDGKPVRDRQDRLVKLFLEAPPGTVMENARTIWKESARYNIGNLERDLNVPTLPLWFLEPQNLDRFRFAKSGEETRGGTRVWVIDYAEVATPTFIKTPGGADVPAVGRLWIEPVSGRILRTTIKASVATITVTYAPREETPGLWPPATMEERYAIGPKIITGVATYSNFRRFQVTTKEHIKPPKLPRP